MSDLHRDKTLALAGIFQSAALADQLAWRGECDTAALRASLDSILVLDTDESAGIFGPVEDLHLGLRTLEGIFTENSRSQRQGEMVRYALGLMHIERKLARDPDLQQKLRFRLETAAAQRLHYEDVTEAGMQSNLGQIYVDTIGTLGFRLQVKGEARHLKAEGMAGQIRASLLAGVRSAWLWHRLGGRRWHLLFTRSQIVGEIREIIRSH